MNAAIKYIQINIFNELLTLNYFHSIGARINNNKKYRKRRI